MPDLTAPADVTAGVTADVAADVTADVAAGVTAGVAADVAADASADLAEEEVVVEANTAEDALEEVTRRLGPGATIVEASKVTRGGIGGFFAREVVQLRARRASGAAAAAPAPAAATAPAAAPAPAASPGASGASAAQPASGGLDGLLASLAAATDEEERSFADVLRDRLPGLAELPSAPAAAAPAAPAAAPAAAPPTAPVAPAAPAAPTVPVASPAPMPQATDPVCGAAELGGPRLDHGEGAVRQGPAWSVRNLQVLGLPQVVLDAVRGCDPADDVACVSAVARALDMLCRPLPSGACIYVGPRARRAATAAGLTTVKIGDAAPEGEAFAIASKPTDRVRSWLGWTRDRRWLHLVVGGVGWRGFLVDEPLAISWASPEDLCEAIRVSAELGLVLGSGPLPWRSRQIDRANPVDLAYAVRHLLPRR